MDYADLGPAMSLAAARDAHKEPVAALEARVVRLERDLLRAVELIGNLAKGSTELSRLFSEHLTLHDIP